MPYMQRDTETDTDGRCGEATSAAADFTHLADILQEEEAGSPDTRRCCCCTLRGGLLRRSLQAERGKRTEARYEKKQT